ncbi:MAG: extracellular solute-binding protein [Clostridia bacterium]|nr:extracellular solute-binding protein [Clostridia bacterium]
MAMCMLAALTLPALADNDDVSEAADASTQTDAATTQAALMTPAANSTETIGAAENTSFSGEMKVADISLMQAAPYKEFLASKGASTEAEALKLGAEKDVPISLKSVTGTASSVSGGDVMIAEEAYANFALSGIPSGLYQIYVEYDVDEARTRDVECAVLLDGALPFEEARDLTLPRLWDNDGEIERDKNGNDIVPSQVSLTFEQRGWLQQKLRESAGYYSEPLLFDLSGVSTLTFVALRESVKIHSITLVAPKPRMTYAEYAAQYKDTKYATSTIHIEGEACSYKNDATLMAKEDRISPMTTPRDGSKIRLNFIGGTNWSHAGQEIFWKFTPTETGLYELRFRTRQYHSNDMYSARDLKINGEIPFAEAADMHFTYTSSWIIYTVSAGDENCRFYFEAGKEYTLSMVVTLGDIGPILERLSGSVSELNDIYRELIMVMSSTPDADRDYQLEKTVPDVLENMKTQADALEAIAANIEAVSGSSGSSLSSLRKTSLQLIDFYEHPENIPGQLNYYKDNIASLSEVMTSAQARPLDIDYLSVAAPESDKPRADSNVFENIWYQMQLFVASFVEDYNSLAGSADDSSVKLTVWTTMGRDQASIINELIRSRYTPSSADTYGQTVGVDLQVVNVEALMPSVAAGNGPDVLMNATAKLPVEYALRGASANLREVVPEDELNEVLTRFNDWEEAIVPFTFNDGTSDGLYALPDQFFYSVLFYRIDVLDQLGIPAPMLEDPWTWDDLIHILPTLQSNNMSVLMETGDKTGADVEQYGINTYVLFLYQNGGQFYTDDRTASALGSEEAVQAFERWTNFYTSYGLPTNFDLLSRFRTGESPLLITDFPFYNNLSVSAPELKGLWSMALVPGTKREDGTVDHTTKGGGTAVILMDAAENKLAGWDFMKWWTSTDTQSTYAQNLECLLGTAARYATANKEAFNSLAWSKSELDVLNAESALARTIPEVPGSYYTPRHINNAFRAVCIKEQKSDPREALLKYAQIISDEIYDKRSEFGLPTE